MTKIDVTVRSPIPATARARQLEGLFDVPRRAESTLSWSGEIDLDFDWNVGLILGPSGSGKTTIAKELFGDAVDRRFTWNAGAVVDDFSHDYSMQDITDICQAVGFNTIPAWLRPYHVLSNGEQFRVELARRLLEQESPVVVDEFTSVVDRQIAEIGAFAVQKYIRKHRTQFVGVSCHYDIIDWLNPDWVIEMPTMALERRSLCPRPALALTLSPVPHAAWTTFAPYHYLTNKLHQGAQCYGLFVGDRIASFAATLFRPHPKRDDIIGISRVVTLPDWQGLGLAFVLMDTIGAAHKALGNRLHMYPAHPPFIRAMDRSPTWKMVQKPGGGNPRSARTTLDGSVKYAYEPSGAHRSTAVFLYVGPDMPIREAELFLARTYRKRVHASVDIRQSSAQLAKKR
jgi:ABC-type uncharacterized transport system YnjBCD ATPase subunit